MFSQLKITLSLKSHNLQSSNILINIDYFIACHQSSHEAELLPKFEADLQEWDCKSLDIDAFHRNERCCHANDERRVRKSKKDEKKGQALSPELTPQTT